MKSAIASLSALAALLAVQPAAAQPAAATSPTDECIWTNAPAPLRDALTAAPTPQEVSTAMSSRLTGETVGAVLTTCKAPLDATGSKLLGDALMAHAMRAGALTRLKAKYPTADTTLEERWNGIPQGVRDRFSAIVDPTRQAAATDADFNAQVLGLMDALKLDSADGQTLYVYLAGRSQIDILRRPKAG